MPFSTPTRGSEQIGREEIRRRVAAAIVEVETEPLVRPPQEDDPPRPTVRQLAALVRGRLDQDVIEAVCREGLITIVRRIQRLKRNHPSRLQRHKTGH